MSRKILSIIFCFISFSLLANNLPYEDKIYGGSKNGIVGTIEDDLQVTPTGQLSYNIPIPSVSGTGGMKPLLSISYTGSPSYGLFGYGFDLCGLSIISRTPSNNYLDNQTTVVNFTETDNFNLDGVRLIQYSTSANGRVIEYRTENESYSRITAYGLSTNPGKFVVNTKSGLTYTYEPAPALLGADSTHTLYWLVTRVEDTLGNFYNCTYEGESEFNDFRIARIDYTGNNNVGLLPYASIRFNYTEISSSPINYVYGEKVAIKKIISSIGVYDGATKVRTFNASYSKKGNKYLLTELREYAGNGKSKNPTSFGWEVVEDFSIENKDYTSSNLINKAQLNIGDFNGDGLSDFIATPQNKDAGWKGWKIFVSNGDRFNLASSGSFSWPENEVRQVECGDFNGDGLADVVVRRYVGTGFHNVDLYLTTIENNKPILKLYKCIVSKKEEYTMYPAEFNCDGSTDLLLCFKNSNKGEIWYSQRTSTGGMTPLYYSYTRTCSTNWDRVELGDFDGDGRTDIMNLNNEGYRIIWGTGVNISSSEGTGSFPEKRHHLVIGDFNNDGKSDILLSGWEPNPQGDWRDWCIIYSKGDRTFERSYVPSPMDARSSKLLVCDINGDGSDDFIAIPNTSPSGTMTKTRPFINDGVGNFIEQGCGSNIYGLDKWRFYIGDVNGDAKPDLIVTSDWSGSNWNGYQLFVMPKNPNHVLSSVTDGLGNKTSIAYRYMTDSGVCKKNKTYSYPLQTCQAPWPLVSEITTPNGIGGENKVMYLYTNPVLHTAGRGFLGFESCETIDVTNNAKTVTEYEINTEVYTVGVKSTKSYIGSKLISESESENTLLMSSISNRGSWPYVFSYVPTKITQRSYEPSTGVVVSEIETTTQYDDFGNPTTVTSVSGDVETVTENIYDNDQEKWILGRLNSASVTKSDGNQSIKRTSTYTYDSYGLLSREFFEPSNSLLGNIKTYKRDSYGNIVMSTIRLNGYSKSDARITTTTYDSKGRYLLSTTDPLNFTQTNTINEALGVITSTVDINGLKTEFEYDGFGNALRSTTPVKSTTEITGWSKGMPDALAGAVFFKYVESPGTPYGMTFFDCIGRKIRTVVEAVGGKKIFTDYEYNSKGQLIRTSEPYFSDEERLWNTCEYDAYGRTVKQTTSAGDITTITYSGLTTVATDPLGHTSTKVVDLNGHLVRSEDTEGNCVEYQYDVDGNCIEMKSPKTLTTMEYDILGNRILVNDSDLGEVKDLYNGFGELIRHTDFYGTTSYEYDIGGRVTKTTRTEGITRYNYDTGWKGSLANIVFNGSEGIQRRNYQYDNYGRVVNESQYINGRSFVFKYSYNSIGQLGSITYPSGLIIRHEYDKTGILVSVKDAKTGKDYWKLNTLNSRGQTVSEQYGNGLATTTQYDKYHGTVSSIVTPGVQNWTYAYDATGNLIQRRDVTRNLTEQFDYDDLNRLTLVRRNNKVTQSIRYDDAGNITYKSDVGSYFYKSGSNQLSIIFDSKIDVINWDDIQYNTWGKICYVKARGEEMTLTYGPSGERVQQKLGNIERNYLGKYFEYEKDLSLGSETAINYIYNGEHVVAIVTKNILNGTQYTKYVHHDQLGSICGYTNVSGKVVQEFSYDAWGRRRNPATWEPFGRQTSAKAQDPHGFGGHEHIDFFEMINMTGRVYDPVVGRFLSADPVIQAADIPQCFNRYAYCLNNPLSLVDPSGYSWFSRNWKALTASIVGIVVAGVTAGIGTGIGAAIISGMAGGAAASLTGALLNGANIKQIAKTTIIGAAFGAASGFLNFASADANIWLSLAKHSFSHGWLEGVQGGSMMHGMMMGAVSKGGGYLVDKYLSDCGIAVEVASNAILSGTLDELGGGKFANGAITGAFTLLFNEMKHKEASPKKERGPSDGEILAGAFTVAATTSAVDGPAPAGEIAGALVVQGAVVYLLSKHIIETASDIILEIQKNNAQRVHLTYILQKDDILYVGRTSGYGDVRDILATRFKNHDYIKAGYKLLRVDRIAIGDGGKDAIRGREQQLMDHYGGIGSPRLANKIRGVSKYNIMGPRYHRASNTYFGELHKYTGIYPYY